MSSRSHGRLALRRAASIAALLAVIALSSRARAVPTLAEKAAAQALFEDGLALMAAKSYAQACPKLEESERLDPALGTRFRLSECEEAIGRLASAWAGFLEVADLAQTAGQTDRATVAHARAAAVEPRLSRIKVIVGQPDTPGLEVVRDGVRMGSAQWGTPVPVDPGHFAITATAPGRRPWVGSVEVVGERSTVTLVVPALEVAPVQNPAAPALLPTPDARRSRGSTILAFGLVGAGAAGVVASGVMGLVAKGNYDGAGAHCGATTCDPTGKSTTDGARSLADVATVFFVGGVVAASVGVVVLVAAPRTNAGTVSASVRFAPGAAWLEGTF